MAAVGHAGGVYTEALQRSSYGCCHTRNPSLALQHSDFLTESLDIPWTTELNAIESIQDGSHPDAQRVDIHGPLQQRHVLHASQFCSARHESLSTPSFVDYLAEVKQFLVARFRIGCILRVYALVLSDAALVLSAAHDALQFSVAGCGGGDISHV